MIDDLYRSPLTAVRDVWRRLPAPLRRRVGRAVNWTGLPYVAGYVTSYDDTHRVANFAGNLANLCDEYGAGDAAQRERLERRFDAILDGLVMTNGVKKTTYGGRQAATLEAVLATGGVSWPERPLRVLDVPASAGSASLEHYRLLSTRHAIGSYVLGDLYPHIVHDRRRRCVFDESGNLLQVAFRSRFFSIHRGFTGGDRNSILAECLLWPHRLAAWYLRRRFCAEPDQRYERHLVLHPEVERRVAAGTFQLAQVDVFRPVPGQYDLILSFNLLQRNYFPGDAIATGVRNLSAALAEGGVLIRGSTEWFTVHVKRGDGLVELMRVGDF